MAKVYFYYSAMNAGKSTTLLQSSYNYHERGMRTLLFIPSIDTRSGGRIKSRIGLDAEALPLSPDEDIFTHVKAAQTAKAATTGQIPLRCPPLGFIRLSIGPDRRNSQ